MSLASSVRGMMTLANRMTEGECALACGWLGIGCVQDHSPGDFSSFLTTAWKQHAPA